MRITLSLALLGGALAIAACADAPSTAADAALDPADGAWLAAAGDNGLLGKARGATAKYMHADAALADGYVSTVDCVSIPGAAMGVHFVKPALIMDAVADAEQPEGLVYEPQKDGSLKLVAVEYIILQGPWQAANQSGVPALFGQAFDVGVGPMGPWYTLHAWTWRHNPDGIFAPFNRKASCPAGAQSSATHAH
ncbi:MAG TPA: hypothetical protein VEA99_09150 [Gemmatimonadaceae bacterium]|nr:hypothetical protein [Gemmatimonadaceae bacterium]